jgi:rare lipoprotein A (peptidoglycan hydrolase)
MASPRSVNALPLATVGLLAILAWNELGDVSARSSIVGHPSATIRVGTCSYYTNTSAKREGTCHVGKQGGCLMASGKELDDQAYTAASWDYPFGTKLEVCSREVRQGADRQPTSRSCVVLSVTDRGPAKRLYRQGRIIDLSRQAFQAVCGSLSQGLCHVSISPRP